MPTLERKLGVLRGWCERVGRDADGIEISVEIPDQDEPGYGGEALLDAHYELGTRLFTLGLKGPDIDLSQVRTLLAWRDRANAR